MLNPRHFREHVIRPTLQHLGLWSESAENLLLGTALVESGLTHLVQLGGGPALSLFQIEPVTHRDVWENYLRFRFQLMETVRGLVSTRHRVLFVPPDSELIVNLDYSCAIARLVYYRSPKSLPKPDDLVGMSEMWKSVFNTEKGKGTPERYVEAWQKAMG